MDWMQETKTLDLSNLINKTRCDGEKWNIEKITEDLDRKIPDTKELVKKTDFNAKNINIKNNFWY